MVGRKIVLLNALIPPSSRGVIYVEPLDPEQLGELLGGAEVESYIGHPTTAALLSRLAGREVPVNRGMYVPRDGDEAVVVRLRKRLPQTGDVPQVDLGDIEVLHVKYLIP